MKVYQYTPIKYYAKKNLINNEIYFSEPNRLNDPFDSKICYSKYTSYKDAEMLIKKSFQRNFINKGKYESMMQMLQKFEDSSAIQGEIFQSPLNCNRTRYADIRLSCFSEVYDSIQMWGHYADKHSGICLGFCTFEVPKFPEKEWFAINKLNDNRYLTYQDYSLLPLKKVTYAKEPIYPISPSVELDIFEKYELFLTTKESNWSYEKEKRAFIRMKNNALVKYPSEILTDVIFWLKMQNFRY